MNFFILGGFFRVDFPLKNGRFGRIFSTLYFTVFQSLGGHASQARVAWAMLPPGGLFRAGAFAFLPCAPKSHLHPLPHCKGESGWLRPGHYGACLCFGQSCFEVVVAALLEGATELWKGLVPSNASTIGSHLGTLALKTEDLGQRIGRFSKTRKWIY